MSIADQVAKEVHKTLSSKLKHSASDPTAEDTPRPSPREGAVKVSQAVVGKGLVEVGGDEDDDDDDDDDKGGVVGGIGLLGHDYDTDGDSEGEGGDEDQKTKKASDAAAPPGPPGTLYDGPSRGEEASKRPASSSDILKPPVPSQSGRAGDPAPTEPPSLPAGGAMLFSKGQRWVLPCLGLIALILMDRMMSCSELYTNV